MHWLVETQIHTDEHPTPFRREVTPDPNSPPPEDLNHLDRSPPLGSIFELSSTPRSFIAWRLHTGRRILELRRIYLTSTPNAAASLQTEGGERSSAPVEFIFPHAILPDPRLFQTEDGKELSVVCVSRVGTYYRLTFPAPAFFEGGREPVVESWQMQEAGRNGGRSGVIAHAVHNCLVVVGWSDGKVTVVQFPVEGWGEGDGMDLDGGLNDPEETELPSSDSFLPQGLKKLLPSSLTRTVSTDTAQSSHQPISITSFTSSDYQKSYAVALCRDRKLRVWDLMVNKLVQVYDAGPVLSGNGPVTPGRTTGNLLNANPKSYLCPIQNIRDYETDEWDFKVAVYVPSTENAAASVAVFEGGFALFGVWRFECVWRKECFLNTELNEPEGFVNMSVVPQAERDEYVLYSAWKGERGTVVRYTDVVLEEDETETAERKGERGVLGKRWLTAIGKRKEVAEIPGLYHLIAQIGLQESFVEYIFTPGRFSLTTIATALRFFESERGLNSLTVGDNPGWEQLRKRALQSVGSSLSTEYVTEGVEDDQLQFLERYQQGLSNEWTEFYLGCLQVQEVADASTGVAILPGGGDVVVVRKGSLGILREASTAEILSSVSAREIDSAEFLCMPEEVVGNPYPSIKSLTTRNEIERFWEVVEFVRGVVGEDGFSAFEEGVVNELPRFKGGMDQFADDLRVEYFAEVVDGKPDERGVSNLGRLSAGLRGVSRDLEGVWKRLLGIVQGGEHQLLNTLPKEGSNVSPFVNAVVGVGVGQVAEARFKIVRDLLAVMVCASALPDAPAQGGGVYPQVEGGSGRVDERVLAEGFVMFLGCWLQRWVCGQRVRRLEEPTSSNRTPALRRGETAEMMTQFSGLSVTSTQKSLTGSDTLALHLLRHHYFIELNLNHRSLESSITIAAARFLDSLGLVEKGRRVLGCTIKHVELAKRLIAYGFG
ncbi:hypothetical protein HK097_001667, partial [Rhizophlyctis rosea]